MRLKSVKLTRFRGYRATTATPIDDAMTCRWLCRKQAES